MSTTAKLGSPAGERVSEAHTGKTREVAVTGEQFTDAMLQTKSHDVGILNQVQVYMESECVAAAKASNVDLAKFNCDIDKLTFVPKPEKAEKKPQ